jgi:hypothetical protein
MREIIFGFLIKFRTINDKNNPPKALIKMISKEIKYP